jgi:hypothetical protein
MRNYMSRNPIAAARGSYTVTGGSGHGGGGWGVEWSGGERAAVRHVKVSKGQPR